MSAPSKGDEIRDPVALQGEVPPSDLFGSAMPRNEGPLERTQEIGFGPLSRDAWGKILARARASEADQMIRGHALDWLEGPLQSLTKRRGKGNGRSSNFSQRFPFWAWHTLAGYEAIHMIRKGQACQCAPGGMAVLQAVLAEGLGRPAKDSRYAFDLYSIAIAPPSKKTFESEEEILNRVLGWANLRPIEIASGFAGC